MTYSYEGVWLQRAATVWPVFVLYVLARSLWSVAKLTYNPWTASFQPSAILILLLIALSAFVTIATPLVILRWWRRRLTRSHLDNAALSRGADVHSRRKVTRTILIARGKNQFVQTIFFPDIGQTHLAAAAYTGGVNLFGTSTVSKAVHCESAAIIPLPVSRLYPSEREPAFDLNFPDTGVDAKPAGILRQMWHALRLRLDATAAEIGEGLETVGLSCRLHPRRRRYGGPEELEYVKWLANEMRKGMNARQSEKVGYVLFGVGRGAEAVLRAVSSMTHEEARQIKGLLLESSLPDYSYLWRYYPTWSRPWLAAFFNWPNPRPSIATPTDLGLGSWKHKHIQILLVNSRADESYNALHLAALQGFLPPETTASILLGHSRKNHFFHDDTEDLIEYEEAAMAFYERVEDSFSSSAVQ